MLLLIKGSNFENCKYNLFFAIGCMLILLFSFIPFWIRCFLVRNEQPITRDIENIDNISGCKEKYSRVPLKTNF